MYKSFRDMPVWIKAHDLAVDVFNMTVDLPRAEDYGLTSQIRRSANSSPANIAEGFGRKTSKDKSHFYIVARGSAYETQNHLLYGNRVKYFSDEDTNRFFDEYANLIFELNKIMKSFD